MVKAADDRAARGGRGADRLRRAAPGRPATSGLKVAEALVDAAPKPIKEGIDRAEADKLKADLEEAGATVELK